MSSKSAPDPRYHVVILGAGRGVTGSAPSAMVSIGGHRRVLDWLLSSFSVLDEPEIHFVGGYKVDEVLDHYPDIRFYFNPDWESTGPARSLSLVPLESGTTTMVSYSDVLVRPETVRQMAAARSDIVLAIDSRWRVRYDGRSTSELDSAEKLIWSGDRLVDIGKQVATDEATAEFAGLMRLAGETAARLHADLRSGAFQGTEGVPAIIKHLLSQRGASVAVVDVYGDWAELNAPQDLARFVLGTKAESLERLAPLVTKGRIGDVVVLSREEWLTRSDAVVKRIRDAFPDTDVIVRSSAVSEDGWLNSAAGAYLSVPSIPANDEAALVGAIDRVIASYPGSCVEDQVLVQEMLSRVSMSGVVMTRTPAQGAPYYVFNFDSTSSRTDTVTSGQGKALRTVYLLRGAPMRTDLSSELQDLLPVIEEIEHLVGHDSLDIEFATDKGGTCHILQVRPIAAIHHDQPLDDPAVVTGVERAIQYFRELQERAPFLVGDSTLFSVMADWNPAEMIGVKPSRLAFSLYRHLITDATWALQRAESGYRDVRPNNLIVDFLGHPYVDLRVDFNSFVPASLPDEVAHRLVNHYLAYLRAQPELHDKVEFEILFTCFTFDLDQSLRRLEASGFAPEEIALLRDSIIDITRSGIERVDRDLDQIAQLEQRFDNLTSSPLPPLELAFAALDDAKRLGIPAFSHLARNAFVAVSMLRSLASAGTVRPEDVDAFFSSVRTVPSAMQDDAARVDSGELTWDKLVERYGHLRPGSYDIASPCYATSPIEYMGPMLGSQDFEREAPASDPWSDATRAAIATALAESALGVDIARFEGFIRKSIEGREFAKFAFMRNINGALEAIAAFGESFGFSREELSRIKIHDVLAMRGAGPQAAEIALRALIRQGAEEAFVTQAVVLPELVFSEDDFTCFEQRAAVANFVSNEKVRAEVVRLSSKDSPSDDVAGRIVLIENADPGFDWLFARDIAGLITMYGGVNSHMAIRAAEFKLPAAIGVGDLQYNRLCRAKLIELDCGSRQIQVVR